MAVERVFATRYNQLASGFKSMALITIYRCLLKSILQRKFLYRKEYSPADHDIYYIYLICFGSLKLVRDIYSIVNAVLIKELSAAQSS
jgi:hypothetical protein